MSLDNLIRRLSPGESVSPSDRARIGGFEVYLLVLTLLFIQPLWRLAAHAANSDLHSHILLVPLVSAYLLYLRRGQALAAQTGSKVAATVLSVAGAGALLAWFGLRGRLSVNDGLALAALAFISFVAAGGFFFRGSTWMRAATFPFSFLIFMVPLPDAWVDWLEKASMLASADAAAFYCNLAGTPHVRQGTVFELPNIVLQVAQECSGIRSSWVLFITSVVAANVFLRTGWSRFLLVAIVIPLGILRNGFRILVIGLLCVHVGPHMVHSPIHHRGGPIFFALSLIPLSILLWGLWWLERRIRSRK
jgi:exosortase C (VPDSG-CTERM-specific)